MAASLLCFACAEIFPASTRVRSCPHCGERLDLARQKRLHHVGLNAYTFGYQYRVVFEGDYRQAHACSARYELSNPGEVMAFAAVAALSGVVGNATYDLLKLVWAKFGKRIKKWPKELRTEFRRALGTDAKRRKFVRYIREYARGLSDIRNRQVRGAIEDEILTHLVIEKRYHIDESKQEKYLLPSSATDYAHMWKHLDTSGKSGRISKKGKSQIKGQ